MSDTAAKRAAWLRQLRHDEVEEFALAQTYDTNWGEIEDTHRAFVGRFCSLLPPDGRVLDAACGTGKYFGLVLGSGRSILGVDQARVFLDRACEKFPSVPTEKHDLQELPYRDEFDGVMCVDAMEFIPPEDWPVVLEGFRRALRPGGWLYLTVELLPEEQVRTANQEARAAGFPVVDRELIWDDPNEGYHHYPRIERVRAWLADVPFRIEDDAEGPWNDGYAHHHVLAQRGSPWSPANR